MADSKKYDGSQWEHSLRKLTTATEAIENPLYSDGTAITSYTIKGNTVQNGTPTPSNPVDVNGVGELTDNLANGFSLGYYAFADGALIIPGDGWVHTDKIPCKASTKYTGSSDIVEGSRWIGFVFWDSNGDYISTSNQQKSQPYPTSISLTVTTPSNAAYMAMNVAGAVAPHQIPLDTVTNFQVTESETVLPYEPYGYKIGILSANTTTPVYLGEVETTRQIRKLVLTGEEAWQKSSEGYNGFYFYMDADEHSYPYPKVPRSKLICNIATYTPTNYYYQKYPWYCVSDRTFSISTDSAVIGGTTVADWKAYLAQRYAAGTPVTIWYVLATPTTGIVNEPIRKIGNYADTLSNAASIPTTEGANSITVDTTVQPSEFTATWTGWHDASVNEWDGSRWIE